jgi:NAD(P)-dependent dehydrogenase (short-subunit alcohol dehydrogenase family)
VFIPQFSQGVSAASSRLAILGGAGGIGRALTTAAAAQGVDVIVLDLEASLARHPVIHGVYAYAVDATDEQSVERVFAAIGQRWDGLDGFVNLCGFMHPYEMADAIPISTFDEIVTGNLRSVAIGGQAAMPLLRRGEGASLVHAASGLAQFIRPGRAAYAAAKAGVIALTKTLALENAPHVRANAIAPSAVDTAFLRGGTGRSDEDGPSNLDIDAYAKAIPMQRIAEVDDIVGPILFLLSDASRYMTGQVLWINGGAYMP